MLEGLSSPDESVRDQAVTALHISVHHQGDVCKATVEALPFLFDIAAEPTSPGRVDVIYLLVSIGRHAVDGVAHGYTMHETAYAAAVTALHDRVDVFQA